MEKSIQKDIEAIKERNRRVEMDKAWETSLTRKILIAILTYVVIVLFLFYADFPKPFVSAIVPTIGFLLSTLSISYAKKIWIRYYFNK